MPNTILQYALLVLCMATSSMVAAQPEDLDQAQWQALATAKQAAFDAGDRSDSTRLALADAYYHLQKMSVAAYYYDGLRLSSLSVTALHQYTSALSSAGSFYESHRVTEQYKKIYPDSTNGWSSYMSQTLQISRKWFAMSGDATTTGGWGVSLPFTGKQSYTRLSSNLSEFETSAGNVRQYDVSIGHDFSPAKRLELQPAITYLRGNYRSEAALNGYILRLVAEHRMKKIRPHYALAYANLFGDRVLTGTLSHAFNFKKGNGFGGSVILMCQSINEQRANFTVHAQVYQYLHNPSLHLFAIGSYGKMRVMYAQSDMSLFDFRLYAVDFGIYKSNFARVFDIGLYYGYNVNFNERTDTRYGQHMVQVGLGIDLNKDFPSFGRFF